MFGRGTHKQESRTLTAQTVPSLMLASAPGDVTPDSALRIADAYACIRALSDAVSSLPLVAYRRGPDGSRERLRSGRLVDLLEQPGPATTQANLLGQLVCHLNTYGNAFVGKYRDPEGTIIQLGLLPPDRVEVKLVRGQPRYVLVDGQGHQTEHGIDDVLHIKAMGTDGLLGLSPVAQCRAALGLSQSLVEHAGLFFQNGAKPTGVLRLPSGIDARGFNSGYDQVTDQHVGLPNQQRIMVVSGDELKFEALSMPPDDLQFFEQRQLSATEVARVFRVPPWIVGAPTSDALTYSTVAGQAEFFVKFSLQPWLTLIEQAFSGDPDLSPQSVFVEFLLDNLLRGSTTERYAVYEVGIRTGILTVDECRQLENLPPATQPAPPAHQDAPTVATAAGNGVQNGASAGNPNH